MNKRRARRARGPNRSKGAECLRWRAARPNELRLDPPFRAAFAEETPKQGRAGPPGMGTSLALN